MCERPNKSKRGPYNFFNYYGSNDAVPKRSEYRKRRKLLEQLGVNNVGGEETLSRNVQSKNQQIVRPMHEINMNVVNNHNGDEDEADHQGEQTEVDLVMDDQIRTVHGNDENDDEADEADHQREQREEDFVVDDQIHTVHSNDENDDEDDSDSNNSGDNMRELEGNADNEENNNSDDNNVENHNFNTPNQSRLSNFLRTHTKESLTSALLIIATKYRHKLSYAATEDMSTLLKIIGNNIENNRSKYHWKNIVNSLTTSVVFHHFCNNCDELIGMHSHREATTNFRKEHFLQCNNCMKQINIDENIRKGNFFLYISLGEQLTDFFEASSENTLYRETRTKESQYAIEDIYDGRLYREYVTNDMISINCSVDGVPVFESSTLCLYPLICTINEVLPMKRRRSAMLVSLWCGPTKPKNMNTFLKPFTEEAQKLHTNGFSYTHKGITYTKKVQILQFVCDSVARPLILNSTQFNGAYGCSLCLHEGTRIAKGNGFTRVYPINEDFPVHGEGLRTHRQTLIDARNGAKGMKGTSVLSEIPGFDIVAGADVDWMHAVLLGVCRQFCRLWFEPLNHEKDFYFKRFLSEIDTLLLSLQPSLEVSRTPRKISDYIHWKAHEWAIFLLFYSVPIFKTLLPKKYADHWFLLVDGVSILLKSSIMPSEIEHAESYLISFIKKSEQLYGMENISFNIHLLSHLAQSVRNWGPLWGHSAFLFEDCNQELLNYIKSSQCVALQICATFREQHAIRKLQFICKDYLTYEQKLYLRKVYSKKARPSSTASINNIHFLGNPKICTGLPRNHFLAFMRLNINVTPYTVAEYYNRVIINDEVIHAKQYQKPTKRCSYCVILYDKEIFQIESFIILNINNTQQPYAIGNYFLKQNAPLIKHFEMQHLISLSKLDPNLAVVHLEDIKEKVIVINISDTNLLIACVYPTHYELLT